MKLNADIIYNQLSKHCKAELYTLKDKEMTLSRAEFYIDGESVFLKNHLYLATPEHLPQRPKIQRGSALVCIGDSFVLNYYRERMNLIIIKEKRDYFRVYQLLQEIFDMYDLWENTLYKDLINGYDIKTLIEHSAGIFNRNVFVLDSSFRVIASSGNTGDNLNVNESGSLNYEAITKYLSGNDLMFDQHKAIRMDLFDTKMLCVNLFNKEERYEGCLCINSDETGFIDGEDKLAEFLAGIIEMAIAKNPQIINDSQATVKKSLQLLLDEMPLSYSQRVILSSINEKNHYVCVHVRYGKGHNRLPLSYICDIFEETFSESYAFTKDGNIVGFINTDSIRKKPTDDYRIYLNRNLNEFVSQMGLCVGISNEFNDLYNIRIHYMQALSAVENGLMLDHNGSFFYFSSYALTQMVVNSLGGLPAEAYFPAGLKELFEHDRNSGVSYLETLKVFLEENMSYTATARKLYIHRSTLIDRISRIEKELNIDLKDSDQRLQLEILLKAVDLEEVLRQQ